MTMILDNIFSDFIINFLWEILFLGLFAVTGFVFKMPKALSISYKLIKNNRSSLSNGQGTRLADVFTHVYNKPCSINVSIPSSTIFIKDPQIGIATRNLTYKQISQQLKLYELVKLENEQIFPIKNLRNWLIYKICVNWLVLFSHEKRIYFKSLKNG